MPSTTKSGTKRGPAVGFAAHSFVKQLDVIGPMLGLSATVTALLLSPIATELPEITNAVIWVRQGKTKPALANISGAMMSRATVPSGIGLRLTRRHFDGALLRTAGRWPSMSGPGDEGAPLSVTGPPQRTTSR
ncbi:hypothetical protein ACH492_27660 [Streptomyces sp. NPDC019443]|uniref:hypothetical protein n=1 Tax=Streptomyces sp. NPDC019443 TaxID=3365061 RepID=UPI0037A15C75